MQPPVQDLRDDALKGGDKYRGALDHNIGRHPGACKTHCEDLQRVDDGGFKIGKSAFGIDARAAHQMKQIRVIAREQEKLDAGGDQRRLTRRLAGA